MWRFFSGSLSGILFYQCRIRNYALSIGLQQKIDCIPIQFLKKGALVILCSHGGNTNETVNAAKLAKEGGYDYFTTTLSISPHKNAQWINEIGEKLADQYGVKHLPSDFKKKGGYLRSIALSEEYHLYRQNYCGCVFSKKNPDLLDLVIDEKEKILYPSAL